VSKPTKEGWYWWRDNSDYDWEVVHVCVYDGTEHFNRAGIAYSEELSRGRGEWGEPVAPNGTRAELCSVARKLMGPTASGFMGYRKGFKRCRQIVSGHIVEILNKW